MHYGMYSEIRESKASYISYELEVNGQTLCPTDFRIRRWEGLLAPFHAFERSKDSSDFATHKSALRKSLSAVGLASLEKNMLQTECDSSCFVHYYKNYLSKALNADVRQFKVMACEFAFENGRYRLLHRKTRLQSI